MIGNSKRLERRMNFKYWGDWELLENTEHVELELAMTDTSEGPNSNYF